MLKFRLKTVLRLGSFICLALCIQSSVFSQRDESPEAQRNYLPDIEIFNRALAEAKDLTFEELRNSHDESRKYVDQLSFEPVEAKYFDTIKKKLRLTEQETELFSKNGFVSVDHVQRYSFGSTYHDIFTSDLPVFVTTDSILHAMHRSIGELLQDIEQSTIVPLLHSILKNTHESILAHKDLNELDDNLRDLDLYLCVARNLLAQGYRSPSEIKRDRTESAKDSTAKSKGPNKRKLKHVSSMLNQDEAVLSILESIKELKIQIPPAGTRIYGGCRPIDYSQFRVRGHYTKSFTLKGYFRCMMWLSRADCGWFIRSPDPTTSIKCDPVRELTNAALLTLCIKEAGQRKNFQSISRLLSNFSSQDDNLTADQLGSLLAKNGIRKPADLANDDRLAKVSHDIERGGHGTQLIRSQVIDVGDASYTVAPPALFQLFGQKYAIDSFVFSNVVYDSIIFENKKVKRYMPVGLDVMAAFGNDSALQLLEPELRKFHYSANLFAVSKYIDACPNQFWQRDLYNVWLDCLRELDKDIYGEEHIPEVMKTANWQLKQLQTQLASWAELRHDMALYAKQSYTGGVGCEYPDAYVEPYPAFYRKVGDFAKRIRDSLIDIDRAEKTLPLGAKTEAEKQKEALLLRYAGKKTKEENRQNRNQFVNQVIKVMSELEAIAESEVQGKQLTDEQILFLQKTIDRRGSMRDGSGSKPRYDGWYSDLFYDKGDVKKWDPTVIDVHTFPNSRGTPKVLELGVGDVNLGVFAINRGDKVTAFVGPLYSYYEFEHPANQRLTNYQWSNVLSYSDSARSYDKLTGTKKARAPVRELPARPEWTSVFQGKRLKRTMGK